MTPVGRLRTICILAGLAAVVLVVRPASPAPDTEEKKIFRPVAPEPEYFKLRNLMANGMMPNYKALWFAFRHEDSDSMKTSLEYMSQLARETDGYDAPGGAGSQADFRRRMAELEQKTASVAGEVGASMNRSAMSARILSVYQRCQACHDVYAPKERQEERKYSPPR
jgi:hypothetical protein